MEIIAVAVTLGALFGAALWFADRCHARTTRAWWVMWERVVEERKVSRDEVASAHQWLVEIAKTTRPHARAEEVAHLDSLRDETSVMLNRVQIMLGVTVDHAAETQRTGGIVGGKGLPGG